MFYLSGNTKDGLLGVKDTKDGVEEFYSAEQLLRFNIDIYGFNKKLTVPIQDGGFEYSPWMSGLAVKYVGKETVIKPRIPATLAGLGIVNLMHCFSFTPVVDVDLSLCDFSNVTHISYMFSHTLLRRAVLPNTLYKIRKMCKSMFFCCDLLEQARLGYMPNLDVSVLATSDLYYTLSGNSMNLLDLSGINVSDLTPDAFANITARHRVIYTVNIDLSEFEGVNDVYIIGINEDAMATFALRGIVLYSKSKRKVDIKSCVAKILLANIRAGIVQVG